MGGRRYYISSFLDVRKSGVKEKGACVQVCVPVVINLRRRSAGTRNYCKRSCIFAALDSKGSASAQS
jgi:hypothetical protein